MKRLEGQVVLVTGASSGFGKSIALACAAEGARVALVARRHDALAAVAAEIEAGGGQARVAVADLSVEGQVEAAVARVQADLGPIDLLVNNAGTNVLARRVTETSASEFRMLVEVNLTSAFLFTHAVLPAMIQHGQGTVVNISSRAALYPDLVAGAGYSAAKMGMTALTKITNEEANPHNVRACLICPGVAETPLLDRRPVSPSAEERRKMLQPEDIAAAVLFVATLPQRVHIETIHVKATQLQYK